tara:strand:- start:10205 stop:11002 length:798 start_codon:yes stop_codon:yes gene_type:complete
MSFITSVKEQLYKINEYVDLIQGDRLNELLLNQRLITGDTNVITAQTNLIKTSTDQVTAEQKPINKAVRIQVAPDPDYKIPVLYGRVTMGGAVTDVCTVNNGQELQFCVTLAMSTGDKIDGTQTTYELKNVYIDNQKINFQGNGHVAASLTDTEGNINTDYNNSLAAYLFDSSTFWVKPAGFEGLGGLDARNVFNTWGTDHNMPGLLFGIVRISWNPDLGLQDIPDMRFDIQSSMTLPGDVLYDYMRNTVYGCGLTDDLIKATSI